MALRIETFSNRDGGNAFFKAMGATPVVIAPSDVYASLERGVVQGLAWPWGSIGKYGWQRFLKYRIDPGFFGATLITMVNKKKWAGLSDSQRAILTKQAQVYQTTSDALIIKKAHVDDAALKKAGVKFYVLKPIAAEKLQKVANALLHPEDAS